MDGAYLAYSGIFSYPWLPILHKHFLITNESARNVTLTSIASIMAVQALNFWEKNSYKFSGKSIGNLTKINLSKSPLTSHTKYCNLGHKEKFLLLA